MTLVELPLDQLTDRIIEEIADGTDESRDFLFNFWIPVQETNRDATLAFQRWKKLKKVLRERGDELAQAIVEAAMDGNSEWAVDLLAIHASLTKKDFSKISSSSSIKILRS